MADLAVELVDRFQAAIGYTQSDEITLTWYASSDSATEYPFSGRFQKLDSILAGYASAWFTSELRTGRIVEKAEKIACFDCRSFVVPNLLEAYHVYLWRQQDAVKNAINMVAQSMFSHKSLQNLNGSQMQEKMFSEKGVNFNDYPPFFKRGIFALRRKHLRTLTLEELACILEQHRPTGPVERSFIDKVDIWLSKQENGVDVLFNNGKVIEG